MRTGEALGMLVEFPEQPRIGPLAAGLARLVRRAPRPSDRGLVVALIPAHNEQDRIGEATLFSVQTLWNVLMARAAGLLPGGGSYVYNQDSVDTDGELTLALVHLGYKVIAAP